MFWGCEQQRPKPPFKTTATGLIFTLHSEQSNSALQRQGLQWNAWWLHYSWRDYNHTGYFPFVVSERGDCGLHRLSRFLHWLRCFFQSIQFTPSIPMETVFVGLFDTSTDISLCGINIPVIGIRQLTTNQCSSHLEWSCCLSEKFQLNIFIIKEWGLTAWTFAVKKRGVFPHPAVWSMTINDWMLDGIYVVYGKISLSFVSSGSLVVYNVTVFIANLHPP